MMGGWLRNRRKNTPAGPPRGVGWHKLDRGERGASGRRLATFPGFLFGLRETSEGQGKNCLNAVDRRKKGCRSSSPDGLRTFARKKRHQKRAHASPRVADILCLNTTRVSKGKRGRSVLPQFREKETYLNLRTGGRSQASAEDRSGREDY